MTLHNFKIALVAGGGLLGGAIASYFDKATEAFYVLMMMMFLDFAFGCSLAAFWGKSPKSEKGGLSSAAGLRGLIKKLATIALVVMAVQFDALLDTTYIGNATIIAFIINEAISILETAGLMGLPVPNILKKAIDLLKTKEEDIDNQKK